MTLHEDIPREVNKFFVNQPLNLGRGGSYPLGPPKLQGPVRHFGLCEPWIIIPQIVKL